MCVYIYIADSFCCIPETNITLSAFDFKVTGI